MRTMVALVNRLAVRDDDDGQDLIEYGLLVALIAIVAIGAVSVVGQTVNNVFWQTFSGIIAGAV